MEFNRLVSLILGVVIVILILVWVSGRLRGGNNNLFSQRNPTITPGAMKGTPTPTPKKGWNFFSFLQQATPIPTTSLSQRGIIKLITPTPIRSSASGSQISGGAGNIQNPEYHRYSSSPLTQIPSTGAPTFLLPLALSSLLGGVFLKRTKK